MLIRRICSACCEWHPNAPVVVTSVNQPGRTGRDNAEATDPGGTGSRLALAELLLSAHAQGFKHSISSVVMIMCEKKFSVEQCCSTRPIFAASDVLWGWW